MKFRSSGKLLITGEYLVLKSAKSLALPTKFGQEMSVKYQPTDNMSFLFWAAYNSDKNIWFEASFELPSLIIISSTDEKSSKDLQTLLSICFNNNPNLFRQNQDIKIQTYLEFPNNWGLGSSSTLIANLAKWSKVDAFKLLRSISKGSGFDVAVGIEKKALVYQLSNGNETWETINFSPDFSENIFFIHLNQKQKSEFEIEKFNATSLVSTSEIETINTITQKTINTENLSEFEANLTKHENLVSSVLNTKTIKKSLFSDYNKGVIKSLGAWGGDFILVTVKNKSDLDYFKEKGYNTILSYSEMILD